MERERELRHTIDQCELGEQVHEELLCVWQRQLPHLLSNLCLSRQKRYEYLALLYGSCGRR